MATYRRARTALPGSRGCRGRRSLVEARKFGNDEALLQSGFVGRVRVAAAQIAHAERREREGRELGIGGELRGVLNFAIGGDPSRLWALLLLPDAVILACVSS